MPRVLLVVHGAVQGVGYRYLVKYIADRDSVKGYVKNVDDGSVEVLAEADEKTLAKFKNDIKIDMRNGPQVFKIEEESARLKEFEKRKFDSFIIEKE